MRSGELRMVKQRASTKLAVFPSSSIPRVLKRVPARFQPRRDISESVAMTGAPLVGGAESAMVKIPT